MNETEKRSNIFNISKSSLFEYLNCPHHYYLHRIEKKKAVNSTDISGLIRGICLHEIEECISTGKEYDIDCIFLDQVSQQLSRGRIKPINLNEVEKKYPQSDIYDLEEENWIKFQITEKVYQELCFDYKFEIDEAREQLTRYINVMQQYFSSIKMIGEKVEIKNDVTIPFDDNYSVHITSIFDKVFRMKLDNLIEIKPELPTKDMLIKTFMAMTKQELQQECDENYIKYIETEQKIELANKLINLLFDKMVSDIKEEIEKKRIEQAEYIKQCGYNENDFVDVVLDIKTSKKGKTEQDIKGMIDPYIYSAVYYAITGRIPVFKIVNIVVTKTKEYYQDFNIILSLELLQDWISLFMTNIESIFIRERFPKNMLDNWKCNPKYCEYFDNCQKDKNHVIKLC